MKKWQRRWLVFILLFSTLHLLRDILQNLDFDSAFTTLLAKKTSVPAPLWLEVTALISETLNIFVSLWTLKTNRFGKLGLLTCILFSVFCLMWAYYTFVL